MHKKFFLLLLLTAVSAPAQAYKVKTFQPIRPAYINPVAPLQDNYQDLNTSESYPKITQIEQALFKRNYENENIYSRLTRVENRIFRRSFSNMPLASRVDNILANVDAGLFYGISQKELGRMEQKLLGQTYQYDDTESRLTRLEKELLGAMQNGNLTERFETVKTASKHYNAYPELSKSQSVMGGYGNGGYSPYSPQTNTQGRGINGILQNVLGAVFGNIGPGTMTGYTPQIYDPYNQYSQYGGANPGMGTQDYYMGNHGGYMNNRNIGNGSSVRILD